MRLKKITSELSPTITQKNFDLRRKLIFNKNLKFLKNCKVIGFKFKRIEPCKLGMIINKDDVVSITRCGSNGSGIP